MARSTWARHSQTIGALSDDGSADGNLAIGGGTLTVGDATDTTYASVFSGTGSLVKQGSGTLAFTRDGG